MMLLQQILSSVFILLCGEGGEYPKCAVSTTSLRITGLDTDSVAK